MCARRNEFGAAFRLRLNRLKCHANCKVRAALITSKVLSDYRVELLEMISRSEPEPDTAFKSKKKISADYARDRIGAVKTFFRWLYETEVTPELPMVTGMYQGDISNLQHAEVDWKIGRITRKRSKTKKHKGVPTVSYLLWKETFKQVATPGTNDGGRPSAREPAWRVTEDRRAKRRGQAPEDRQYCHGIQSSETGDGNQETAQGVP